MERKDEGLAFLLKYENVAWFEEGKVRILDRRIYPTEIQFVECCTYEEVTKAVHDMVTQSAGPYTAIGMGMALAAWQARDLNQKDFWDFMSKAADSLSHARPTTYNRYKQITDGCLESAKKAVKNGECPYQSIFEATIESLNRRYSTMEKVAEYLVDLIPDNGNVLTQCFGETINGMMCRVAKRRGKKIHFYHAETRPYLQGARLTSSVSVDMGFEATVLTDNMIAYAMKYKNIDLFTSAADTIARDGSIANKIGTFQIAILADYFGIPYFVTGIPDADKVAGKDIVIEERDPKQVLEYRGIKNTLPMVDAIYPSFDITPPRLISGVVTDKGVFSPYDLKSYFEKGTTKFY